MNSMTEPTTDVRHPVEGPATPTPSWAGPYRTVEGRDEVLVPCDLCGQPMYDSCRERRWAQGRRDCGLFCDFLGVAGPDRREARLGLDRGSRTGAEQAARVGGVA